MKKLFLLLLVSACSSPADLKNLNTEQLSGGVLCGWVYKKTVTLPMTSAPELCLLVKPTEETSVMPVGADNCDAEEGNNARVWVGGTEVDLFVKTGSSVKATSSSLEVPCPS